MNLFLNTELFELRYIESGANSSALFERHCHFRFEMIAVMSGRIEIIIEGRAFECRAGDLAVIPPLTYHSVVASGNAEYKRVTALFDGGILPENVLAGLSESVKLSPIRSHSAFQYIFSELQRAISSGDSKSYSQLADSAAIQLIYTCADDIGAVKSDIAHGDGILERAIRYIDGHIEKKLTLSDIADALFVSHSSLCHVFSERMQISPKQYIIQKKMAYATMLIEGGMPMTEAARAVGYDNYSNFYRMYKKTGARGG